MQFRTTASAGALFVMLGAATPALADLSAEDVWSSWKNMAEGYGQTVSGTERRQGDRLTIGDLILSSTLPEGGAVTAELGELVFTERDDGAVEIAMPDSFPIEIGAVGSDSETVEMGMTVAQQGLSMVATGTPDEIAYDMAAPGLRMTLDSMRVDGEPVDATMDIALEELAAAYTVARGAATGVEGTVDVAATRFVLAAEDPAQGMAFDYQGAVREIRSTVSSSVPRGMQDASLGRLLSAGLTASGRVDHQGLDYAGTIRDGGDRTEIAARFGPGSVDYDLDRGGVLYDVRSENGQVSFAGADLPLPQVEIGFDDSSFRIEMPLVETEDPTDFGLAARYTGLTVSDGIWAMFDPAGQLPRDPMTLVLDLGGKARLFRDITDPAAMAEAQAGGQPVPPGELHSLNVKDLQLSVAGADLTGSGAFTFDNADTATFDGMPKPTGSLTLRLEGGNTLLDRLVNMGLVPQDQATGLRMMLGMFARPTGAGDTLVSEITVTEDGQVLANGQRLR